MQTEAWRKTIRRCIVLRSVKRQNDERFVSVLNAVRAGRLTTPIVQALLTTRNNVLNAKDGIVPTRLCTHRRQAAQLNEQRLKELTGELRTFTAVDSAHCPTTLLDTACAQKLQLKIGAQVLLTKNLDLSKQLCNGSRGVIQAFDRESGEISSRLGDIHCLAQTGKSNVG